MELISIVDLAKQAYVSYGRIRKIIKERLKIKIQINEKQLQCVTLAEAKNVLDYINNGFDQKRKTDSCSFKTKEKLEKDRAERKERFVKLYGPETEKWFNPNWWPTPEEITPAYFREG